jgi:hypothetical protein
MALLLNVLVQYVQSQIVEKILKMSESSEAGF